MEGIPDDWCCNVEDPTTGLHIFIVENKIILFRVNVMSYFNCRFTLMY